MVFCPKSDNFAVRIAMLCLSWYCLIWYSIASLTADEGKVLEWLKRHVWKACIPLKGIGGSNPPLSAKITENQTFPHYYNLSD